MGGRAIMTRQARSFLGVRDADEQAKHEIETESGVAMAGFYSAGQPPAFDFLQAAPLGFRNY